MVFQSIGKHGHAERASCNHGVTTRLQGFFGACHKYFPITLFGLFKHLTTSCATAHGRGFIAIHFVDFQTQGFKHLSWRKIFAISSSQVAGIVKGNVEVGEFGRDFKLSFFNHALQKLTVVFHFKYATKFGILVFQNIEFVGITSDNSIYVVQFQSFDVHQRLHLEGKFVTRAFGQIARIALFGSQNTEGYPKVIEYASKIGTHFFGSSVETSCRAHPEKVFGLLTHCRPLSHGLHFNFLFSIEYLLSPIAPIFGRKLPRSTIVFDIGNGIGQSGWRSRGFHIMIAAQLVNDAQRINLHRACLGAGVACGASPQLFGSDAFKKLGAIGF